MHYLERDRRTVMPGHDPRRPERVQRYQPGKQTDVGSPTEHINALGMVCSLLGLLMRVRVTLRVCQKSVKNLISFHYTHAAEVGSMDWCLLFFSVSGQQPCCR